MKVISTVFSIIIALLVFGVLIFSHEMGHFFTAKAVGINVEEFSIGMGPAIFKRKGRNTLYSVRALPIGGYVKLEGEDGELKSEHSFSGKPAWAKLLVLFAGAFMNILMGLLISVGITAAEPYLPSTTIGSFMQENMSSAQLQTGDEILAVDGKRVYIARDVDFILTYSGGKPVDVTVVRNGEKIDVLGVSFVEADESGIHFYERDFYFTRGKKTFGSVLHYGFFQAIAITRSIWTSLGKLITGQISASSLSGPVGTTQAIGQAASLGFSTLMYIMMFISINLGIVNLLPFPALDGGRILIVLIEKAVGKKIPEKVEAYINFAGFVLLMALMVFVTFSDIKRLF